MSEQTGTQARRDDTGRVLGKTCHECGQRPIDRSTQGRDSTMCEPCYDYAGWENTHSDESHSEYNITAPPVELINSMDDCPVCHPELDPRNQPQPARRATASAVLGSCCCSTECTATTRKIFAQGHDARMVSLLVRDVTDGSIDASVAETRIAQAGGNSALIDKFRTALANRQAKDAQPKRQAASTKPATRLTPAMADSLQFAIDYAGTGAPYVALGQMRTGTCVALLGRGLLDYVHGDGGSVVGHKINDAGREALAAHLLRQLPGEGE